MSETLVGSSVGDRKRYEICRLLGHGGMADVYLAHDLLLDRAVALKLVAEHLAHDQASLDRFRNEARVLAAINHPHIVQVHDFGQIGTRPYLAMQFLEGRSLAEAIRLDGPWSVTRTARLLDELASALDYAHQRNLLHRDIKPANVMISTVDRATLTDFGVATTLRSVTSVDSQTMTASTAGTAAYMSPEQIQGSVLGPACDVYSLGATIYEVMSGRPPFHADNPVAMINQVINEDPPALDVVDARIPPDIARVVTRAISKHPNARYSTAGEFAAAFHTAMRQGAVNAPTTDPRLTIVGYPSFKTGASAARRESDPQEYRVAATRSTPALLIYLVDMSGSMGEPMGATTRLEVVKQALTATVRQMVARSTRGVVVSPRYRLAILGYSDRVYDLIGGVQSVDQLVSAKGGVKLELSAMSTTDSARAFSQAYRILSAELPKLQSCPAPIVVHLTDGEFTGDDPTQIAEEIRAMRVQDGNVLIETVFISDQMLREPVTDVAGWPGITASTPLHDEYAETLRRMSSAMPATYRHALAEYGYHLDPAAVMLLPGTNPELVRLAFQVSGMTGSAVLTG